MVWTVRNAFRATVPGTDPPLDEWNPLELRL
jgi:hypothetical protein